MKTACTEFAGVLHCSFIRAVIGSAVSKLKMEHQINSMYL